MTRIAGVASTFPRHYYRQQEVASALKRHWGKGLENPDVLDRLLTRAGVDGRYFALPIEAYDDLTTWGKSNNAWIDIAEDLAEQSICRALWFRWNSARSPGNERISRYQRSGERSLFRTPLLSTYNDLQAAEDCLSTTRPLQNRKTIGVNHR